MATGDESPRKKQRVDNRPTACACNCSVLVLQRSQPAQRRVSTTLGTFEVIGPKVLEPQSVDIAFVDAIHTSDFVLSQFRILLPLIKEGGLVLFDDINFSRDMKRCWKKISKRNDLKASGQIGRRIGIIELK